MLREYNSHDVNSSIYVTNNRFERVGYLVIMIITLELHVHDESTKGYMQVRYEAVELRRCAPS